MSASKAASRGRPPSTSHAEVQRVALEIFARDGFENTTMDDIAGAVGVGRRTLFRYFASKNDMVWGDFEAVLSRLRDLLAAASDDVPVMRALSAAIVASNHYEADQLPELRIRMTLITTVPALQAHAMLRYASWREVVADYVAMRRGEAPNALVPQTLSFVTLGASMAAFSQWVANPDADLGANLAHAFATLDGSAPVDP